MPLVIDASVTLVWCFDDEESDYADRVLERAVADEVVVPPVWASEVGNGLVSGQRRSRIEVDEFPYLLGLLSGVGARVVDLSLDELLGPVAVLALAHNLTVYDASYLHIAMRESLPLATLDRRLRAAAAGAGCALFE
ncbi:MAG: type II toxin-antitoxin system VapC family toxin [bacterium]